MKVELDPGVYLAPYLTYSTYDTVTVMLSRHVDQNS